MNVLKISLSYLRNAAHNGLMNHCAVLVNKYGAAKLGIASQFTTFSSALKLETDFLAQTSSSDITERLVLLDDDRDAHYRSFVSNVGALTKHFTPSIVEAANRIMHVLSAKGDITVIPYNDETIEINNVITELFGTYATDVKTINLTEWISILKIKNDAFDTAYKERNNQQASKIQAQTKVLRDTTDKAYTAMIKRIDSLIEVNGDANYKAFVNEYNKYVEAEKHLIAQRAGRSAAAKKAVATTKTAIEQPITINNMAD